MLKNFWLSLWFMGGFFLLICVFWTWRGNVKKAKEIVSGSEIVEPEVLQRLLKNQNIASPFTVGDCKFTPERRDTAHDGLRNDRDRKKHLFLSSIPANSSTRTKGGYRRYDRGVRLPILQARQGHSHQSGLTNGLSGGIPGSIAAFLTTMTNLQVPLFLKQARTVFGQARHGTVFAEG